MATGGRAPVILHLPSMRWKRWLRPFTDSAMKWSGPGGAGSPADSPRGGRAPRVRVFTLLPICRSPSAAGISSIIIKPGAPPPGLSSAMPGNGEIGIIIGDNRFTCQKAVRSAFAPACENRARQQILEPVRSHERADIAVTVTEQMLTQYPALQAIYAPCGGVEGIVDALRDSGRQQEIALVCHGPLSDSELALIDGTIDIMLNHRLDEFAAVTLRAMADAASRPIAR